MHGRVHAANHLIGVFDGDHFPDMFGGTWDNGLALTFERGAGIYTGINRGYTQVEVIILDSQPPEEFNEEWEAVVEIDVAAASEALHVESLEWGAVQELPVLNPQGPGLYRLRVHALGRDIAYDDAVEESEERYLLQIWPQNAPQGTRVLAQRDSTSTHLLQAIELDRQQGL